MLLGVHVLSSFTVERRAPASSPSSPDALPQRRRRQSGFFSSIWLSELLNESCTSEQNTREDEAARHRSSRRARTSRAGGAGAEQRARVQSFSPKLAEGDTEIESEEEWKRREIESARRKRADERLER